MVPLAVVESGHDALLNDTMVSAVWECVLYTFNFVLGKGTVQVTIINDVNHFLGPLVRMRTQT